MIRQPRADPADDQLMALYAGGDFLAFRRLFEHVAPWLRAFFRRSFSDRSVADDLTQATFLRLHGARASYQAGRPLRPWLYSIALGVRRDELRRRQRQPRQVDSGALDNLGVGGGHDGHDGHEDATATSELTFSYAPPAGDHSEAVREAIRSLPESQRVVIQLHQFEGLTFDKIAERLGTTPGAVRVRASRAYERLRDDLRPLLARLDSK